MRKFVGLADDRSGEGKSLFSFFLKMAAQIERVALAVTFTNCQCKHGQRCKLITSYPATMTVTEVSNDVHPPVEEGYAVTVTAKGSNIMTMCATSESFELDFHFGMTVGSLVTNFGVKLVHFCCTFDLLCVCVCVCCRPTCKYFLVYRLIK